MMRSVFVLFVIALVVGCSDSTTASKTAPIPEAKGKATQGGQAKIDSTQ